MTDQMVMKVYYLYQNLPKKTLRELKAFSDAVEEAVYKPSKVHGTCWINQKFGGGGNSFKPLWNLHDTGRMIESNRCTAAEIAVNLCDL